MKRKNMATMVTCIALVGAVAVGGTLALLSANANTLTNTFTIGNGYPKDNALVLDEAVVGQVKEGVSNFGGYEATNHDVRTKDTQKYENLVANTDLDKDPTFHLAATSPDSWIIAKVTGINDPVGTNDLKDKNITIKGTLPQDYGWLKLDTTTNAATPISSYDDLTDGYYVTKTTIKAGASTDDLFEQLHVGADVVRGTLPNVVINGVAVEAVTGEWDKDGAAVVAQAKTADFIPED